MWDKVKEYFTAIFAQGFWWGGKAKGSMEWMEENKTSLYVIVGIIIIVVILVYMRPYAAIVSKTKR